jgi:hypothetical protein
MTTPIRINMPIHKNAAQPAQRSHDPDQTPPLQQRHHKRQTALIRVAAWIFLYYMFVCRLASLFLHISCSVFPLPRNALPAAYVRFPVEFFQPMRYIFQYLLPGGHYGRKDERDTVP